MPPTPYTLLALKITSQRSKYAKFIVPCWRNTLDRFLAHKWKTKTKQNHNNQPTGGGDLEQDKSLHCLLESQELLLKLCWICLSK